MSWSWASLPDAKSLAAGLPSLEQLKRDLSARSQDLAARSQDLAAAAAASAKSTAAQLSHAESRSALLNKVAGQVQGVFDLDALQSGSGVGGGGGAARARGEYVTAADLTYVTERLALMGVPAAEKQGRTPAAVAAELNARHGREYVVWNLSEVAYDTSAFHGEVVELSFPGYPAPPLATLFKLCMSIESWLAADARNVAVVHCVTGRGRSIVVAACLLEWLDKANAANEALAYLCRLRRSLMEQALVPTQVRYARMFHGVLAGIRPRVGRVRLERLRVRGAPHVLSAADMARTDLLEGGRAGAKGLRPYLQVYKDGACVFSTSWADADRERGTPFFLGGEPGCEFELRCGALCVLEGDVLLRLRHLDTCTGKGETIFRYGFHTGFAPLSGVLALRREDLDGGTADARLLDDMTVEIEFSDPDAPRPAHGGEQEHKQEHNQELKRDLTLEPELGQEGAKAMAAARAAANNKPSGDGRLPVDGAFWDEVERKQQDKAARRRERKQNQSQGVARGSPGGVGQQDQAAATPGTHRPAVHEFAIFDDEEEEQAGIMAKAAAKQTPARADTTEDKDLFDALNALASDDSNQTNKPEMSATAAVQAAAPASAPTPAPPLTPAQQRAAASTPAHTPALTPTLTPAHARANSASDGSDGFLDDLEALADLGLDEPPPKLKPSGGTAQTPPAARDEDTDLAELESFLDGL